MSIYKLDNCLYPFALLKINASIALHDERIWCTYRSDHLFNFDSKSFITELDSGLNPISHKRLSLEDRNSAFEDVRLISFNSELVAIYTYLPKNTNGTWDWQYSVGIGVVDVDTGVIKHQQPLHGLADKKHEKNWVPYIFQSQLFIITNFDPHLRVLGVTGSFGKLEFSQLHLAELKTKSWNFGEIRGGTPLLQEPGGDEDYFYGFTHSCIHFEDGDRTYSYTAVRYSHSKKVFDYYDSPFGFSDGELDVSYQTLWKLGTGNCATKCIFPMGIINFDDGIVMSYGQDDCVSRLKFYPWHLIKQLFN